MELSRTSGGAFSLLSASEKRNQTKTPGSQCVCETLLYTIGCALCSVDAGGGAGAKTSKQQVHSSH